MNVVMLGATGAVGTEVVRRLLELPQLRRLTLLGRRYFDALASDKIEQHIVDVMDPSSYTEHLNDADTAICTLGVGQPSKVSKAEFLRLDRDVVVDFAKAAKIAGCNHFLLLSSVGANSRSASFFFRSKGDLEDTLDAEGFERLSLFHPSMIITPENRYGLSQALTLALWPKLSPLFIGGLRKLRGINVGDLGVAMANATLRKDTGAKTYEHADLMCLLDKAN